MTARVEAARVSGMKEGAAAAASGSMTQRSQDLPASPTEDEGVEPFEINDVFLIYKDGRMIVHSKTKETEALDRDLMSSMLVAIQGFVKESFQDGLNSFECSNKKVVMVPGNYLILVAVVDGTEPKVLRDEMQSMMTKIEGLYSGVVEDWDGNTGHFKDVRPFMVPLFMLHRQLKIRKMTEAVKVKSGIEFFGGFVRLKVGVSNGLEDTITLVALTLTYDTMSLSLSHIEPEYPLQGSKIFLNDIKPKEKRSVAIYFDPIICQESSIEGRVTYFDGNGVQGSAVMKTRPVDIVCPIFYTKENINVAMLKRLIPELKYNDSKVYQIPDVENLKVAYKVALGCVQAHDVKPVREFGQESPYEAEMWYYGEVKGTDEQMVIRVSAREWQHYLSIFVASRNLATMTGLLAEIGKDFGRAMEQWTAQGAMTTLVDENIKGEIAKTLSLLEKETEAEASPAESDTKGPAEKGPGKA